MTTIRGTSIPATEPELREWADAYYRRLSGAARDVMGQMFLQGPIQEDSLESKAGRSELVELGLAHSIRGWNWLTDEGTMAAAFCGPEKNRWGWRRKQAALD